MQTGQESVFWARWSKIMRIYEETAAGAGLSVLQLRVLETADRLPGCTQKTLCGQLDLSKQRINLLVRQFTEQGILELAPDEADARRKNVRLTQKGREYAAPLLEPLRRKTAEVLAPENTHVHVAPDGTVTEHAHGHAHDHGHTHPHEHTKEVLDRLARLSGHLNKVRSMVESGADCSEVLIQLAAVKSAVNNTGKLILKDHISHCLVDAIECGDPAPVEELKKAIDQFIK